MRWAGNVGILGRLTREDFKRTTERTFWNVCPKEFIDHEHSLPSKGYHRFINGSELYFAHFRDKMQFFSGEIGFAALDEISELEDDSIWNTLDGRLRHALNRCVLHAEGMCPPPAAPPPADQGCPGKRPRYYLLGAGNPAGHDWVWQKAHPESPQKLQGYQWFRPQPFENAENLPGDYYQKLIRDNSHDWVSRFVLGSSNVFEKQIWKEWNDEVHLIDPVRRLPTWINIVALDHGITGQTACVWMAVDHSGNLIFYRDYRKSNLSVQFHAEEILSLTGSEKVDEWKADPMIWQVRGARKGTKTPYTIWDEYAEYGIEWTKADNDLAAGISRVATFLNPDPERPFPAWHPKAGQGGSPRLFVFRTCKEIKTYVPQWRYKADSERPSEAGKDTPDSFRYAVMSREAPEINPGAERLVTTEDLRRAYTRRLATIPSRVHARLNKAAIDRMVSRSDLDALETFY